MFVNGYKISIVHVSVTPKKAEMVPYCTYVMYALIALIALMQGGTLHL